MARAITPFEIHPSSGVPIYRQLIDQVLALVASGKLAEGDLLPSVRQVAQAAAVNPMTVSKAYSQLESQGVVTRIRGQGMRVARPALKGTLAERRREFRSLAEIAVCRARQLGLSEADIRRVVDSLINDTSQDHKP